MAESMTLDYLGSEATKTQIFSASEVAKRLPMVKCIESTSEALKALSSGKGILLTLALVKGTLGPTNFNYDIKKYLVEVGRCRFN